MKKLFAVFAVAFTLVTGLFAKDESLTNISVNFPNMISMDLSAVGFDIHSYTMSSDLFGYTIGSSFSIPTELLDLGLFSAYIDCNFGLALRFINTDKLSMIVSPGVFLSFFELYEIMILSVGLNVDLCASFKLTDSIYITGGAQASYSMYDMAVVGSLAGGSSGNNLFTISPRIGITLKK